jgi:hypothetical protein
MGLCLQGRIPDMAPQLIRFCIQAHSCHCGLIDPAFMGPGAIYQEELRWGSWFGGAKSSA